MVLAYEDFKKINDNNKLSFRNKGHIEDVTDDICVLRYQNKVQKVSIESLVKDITNGMGVVSNPSAIKRWKGWNKDNEKLYL